MELTNQEMTTFMSDNNFINIIKSNTCFKTSTGIYTDLKVQSCKLYNNKYMIASTQATKTEIFAFIS